MQERAEKLMKTVVPDLTDPFNVADLSEAVLLADPARLSDEAAAISMMGGRRVVRVRGAGNGLAELFEFPGDRPATRWWWWKRAISPKARPCASCSRTMTTPPPSPAIPTPPATWRMLVRDALRAEGLRHRARRAGRRGVAAGLGSRRDAAGAGKAGALCQGQKSVSLDDVRAVMGDEAEARAEEARDAAGSGDFARLDLALERLWTADTRPSPVIRGAMGHFQRLVLVRENMARGDRSDGAMKRLRPPVHFLRADTFKAQAAALERRATGRSAGHAAGSRSASRPPPCPPKRCRPRLDEHRRHGERRM